MLALGLGVEEVDAGDVLDTRGLGAQGLGLRAAEVESPSHLNDAIPVARLRFSTESS